MDYAVKQAIQGNSALHGQLMHALVHGPRSAAGHAARPTQSVDGYNGQGNAGHDT